MASSTPHGMRDMCEFHRIMINGNEEHSIHGKRIRRDIKEIADREEARGSVRNIKNKPQVEIRIMADRDRAVRFCGFLEKEVCAEPGLRLDGPHTLEGEQAGEYIGFRVIREDELTEMVWALQGAGDVFLMSAEGQKAILGEIKNRDMRKEYSRLAALSVEMESNLKKIVELAGSIEKGERGISGKDQKFRDLCLSQALREPAYPDNTFIQATQDVYYAISDLRESIWKGKDLDFLEKKKMMMEEYKKSIDGRMDEIGPGIGMERVHADKAAKEEAGQR